MKQITYTCNIIVDDNDDVNGEHLCEEIQSYLNSAYYYETDNVIKAQVVGYKIYPNQRVVDNITPFTARSEY